MTVRDPPPAQPESIAFGSFRIDVRTGRLLQAGKPIPVRPKTWSVLLHLAQRPGVLVSKDELLNAVWPDVAVTPDTLTKSIGELRLALGDDARTPRYIETAHRRGFRFIADLEVSGSESLVPGFRDVQPESRNQEPETKLFVGRDAEIHHLERQLAQAHAGQRQIVFITGAAGIGKTTLLGAFLDSPRVRGKLPLWIGRGTCVEQHGAREAYMPVLEVLGRLARRPDAGTLIELLPRVAPTWLAQMPWLVGHDGHALPQTVQTAKPERMLREFAELIESLTSEVAIVLVLEDLHWSDPSTVNLLAMLGQRQEPARLLVVGTYRPAEVAVHDHPLSSTVQTLRARRQCVELPVHELTMEDVRRYLEERFPHAPFSSALAPVLHHHTDGNPLFMVAVVEHMVSRGLILETAPGWALSVSLERMDLGVPDGIAQTVETHIETLSPADRTMLEFASVSGVEFAVPAVACAMDSDATTIEACCESLARLRRFLRVAGSCEWPDGSVTRRYAFTHEVHRQVVYAAIPDGRRRLLHKRIAEALESAYHDRVTEIAAELAAHFERSSDPARAIRYLTIAGTRARQRCANREALGYLESALAAVKRSPDQGMGQRQELEVRLVLGPALSDLDGYASEAVRENYERADVLCARMDSPAEHFEVIYALCHYHAARGHVAADAMAARLDALADRLGTAEARLRADSALVRIALVAARFAEARTRMQGTLALDSLRRSADPPEFGPDPTIDANTHYALALGFMGYYERARATARASIDAARANGTSLTQAAAFSLGAILEILHGNADDALALAEEAVSLCTEQGFAYWHAMASAVRGQAWVVGGRTREGLDELARARIALDATGALVFSTHILAFLAEAHRRNGNIAEALAKANEGLALADSSMDRTYLPELWRLKGELLLAVDRRHSAVGSSRSASGRAVDRRRSTRDEAERCLLRALDLARECGARSLELRAASSLARAWRASAREVDAHDVLAPVCEWFGPDAQGRDLDDARALLDELRRSLRPRSAPAPRTFTLARKISANLPKTFRT